MQLRKFVASSFVSGLLIIIPVYLALLLVFRAMKSLGGLVKPFAKLLPQSLPSEEILSFLLVMFICFVIGALVRTPWGESLRERVERSLFDRIPGYELFRSLTQQMSGKRDEHIWKPALAEIEEALVPAFITEEFEDGRYTVFVPASPTPITGTIYILTPDRVHPLDCSFTEAIKSIVRWGSGSKDLVKAMNPDRKKAS
jgi:uncharacterized membrane protein